MSDAAVNINETEAKTGSPPEKSYLTLNFQGQDTKSFMICVAVAFAAMYLGFHPKGFFGAFAFCTVAGVFLWNIGDNLPIIKDYFGGGAIVCIFGSALMAHYGLFPEAGIALVKDFNKSMDYLGYSIPALMVGALICTDRDMLIFAGKRYALPVIGGLIGAAGAVYLVGALLGYGGLKSLFTIGLPIMGGGVGAGAVPLAQILAGITGDADKDILALLMPAVALGNAISIIAAGLLDKLGRVIPKWSGEGELVNTTHLNVSFKGNKTYGQCTVLKMGVGFLLCYVFYTLGIGMSKIVGIHGYACTIILAGAANILRIIPEDLEEAIYHWYQFIIKVGIPASLILVGIAVMNMSNVIAAFTSWQFIVLCFITVIGCILGSAFVGKLVGFYPIESSITAGLCMSNMGGSGDVAVLGAANRMQLMQFAQISSRLGGAFILLVSNILGMLLLGAVSLGS